MALHSAGESGKVAPMTNTYPALTGATVTQAHVQKCRDEGHATHTIDGVDQRRCPRCGADRTAFGIHAGLVANAAMNDHGVFAGDHWSEAVDFEDLALVLAEMDVVDHSLSYQEQAAWILARTSAIRNG